MKHLSHQLTVTWQHIRRSPYQALAAIMIMTLTMFAGLTFVLLSFASHKVLLYLEQRPKIIAFYKDPIKDESQLQGVENQLKETGKAQEVKFVSKDQAFQIYKERYKKDPLLLELVSANTLPTSLEVSATNVSDLPALYEILKASPNLDDILYQQDVVSNLIKVMDWGRKFGAGLVTFLLTTSLFIILTIIGLKIALKRDEIEVQRLVGASKWYIRLPFLLEGFFYGAFGTIASWSTIYILLALATPYLLPYFSGLALLPVSPLGMLELLAGALLTGGVVGIFGSFLAVWRYLKD